MYDMSNTPNSVVDRAACRHGACDKSKPMLSTSGKESIYTEDITTHEGVGDSLPVLSQKCLPSAVIAVARGNNVFLFPFHSWHTSLEIDKAGLLKAHGACLRILFQAAPLLYFPSVLFVPMLLDPNSQ